MIIMLTLMASQAQEESLSCSENCKWRIRKGFEQGQPSTCTMLGYRLVDGEIKAVPNEAEIVREIFDLYLCGYGVQKITNVFNELGVQSEKISFWHPDTIRGILRNEKYVGDLLLQKTLRENHLSKKQVLNKGQLPQFYITDDHEPIISREQFAMVQDEIAHRAEKRNHAVGKASVFTGKIHCAVCGKNYRRKKTPCNVVWCCSTFNTRGKAYCASKVIPEETLKTCLAQLLGDDTFVENDFENKVDRIIVKPGNIITVILKDGIKKEIQWQDRSRSESWTAEMRESARKKRVKGASKNGK